MDEARTVARKCYKDPEHRSTTLAREELGLIRTISARPWGAAVFSFLAFTVGAINPARAISAEAGPQSGAVYRGVAVWALFVVGTTLSLFTGRGALWRRTHAADRRSPRAPRLTRSHAAPA